MVYPNLGYCKKFINFAAAMDKYMKIRLDIILREVLRSERGHMPQKEAAQKVGKPQSYVSKIEGLAWKWVNAQRMRKIGVIELWEYCRMLGVPLSEVIKKWEDRVEREVMKGK